jgi:hypothetical protein
MKSLYIQVPKTHSTHREKWPGCVLPSHCALYVASLQLYQVAAVGTAAHPTVLKLGLCMCLPFILLQMLEL